jgi:hypothetical protein
MQILVKRYIWWFVLETVERRFSLVYLSIRWYWLDLCAGPIHRHSRVVGAIPGLAALLADNQIALCGFNVDAFLLDWMFNLSGNFVVSSSTI